MPMSQQALVEGTSNPPDDKVGAVRSRKRHDSAMVAVHDWDTDHTDLAYLETIELLKQPLHRLVVVPRAFLAYLDHGVGGLERLKGRYCWFFDC